MVMQELIWMYVCGCMPMNMYWLSDCTFDKNNSWSGNNFFWGGSFSENNLPLSLALPPDTRGIHASCSGPSVMPSSPYNLLVHSSSPPMEK